MIVIAVAFAGEEFIVHFEVLFEVGPGAYHTPRLRPLGSPLRHT
jgi:hypothetical protein